MIGFVAACIFAAHPLVATGNQTGQWFVGDLPPGLPRAQYEIRSRESNHEYRVLQSILRRPIAMAVHERTMWFIDSGDGVLLYRLPLLGNRISKTTNPATSPRATLQSLLQTEHHPTGLVILDENPVVVCSGETLELFQFSGTQWNNLPLLAREDVQIASVQGNLIAAAQHPDGIEIVWFVDGNWQKGKVFSIEGELVDLIVREDWPLIVTKQDGAIQISGIQGSEQLLIATSLIPKGRWKVIPSSLGVSILSVERKGVTTATEIGWPSGQSEEPIELNERFDSSGQIITTLTIVLPLVLLLVMISILRGSSGKPSK